MPVLSTIASESCQQDRYKIDGFWLSRMNRSLHSCYFSSRLITRPTARGLRLLALLLLAILCAGSPALARNVNHLRHSRRARRIYHIRHRRVIHRRVIQRRPVRHRIVRRRVIRRHAVHHRVVRHRVARHRVVRHRVARRHLVRHVYYRHGHRYYRRVVSHNIFGSTAGQVWTTKPIAYGLSDHDVTTGEDPEIRAAAVKALGDLNGTAVVVNPNTGRILAMVNQGLALSSDYQPCSTTKMAIALAALDQGIVNENTPVRIGPGRYTNMTDALAYSINAYFEALGNRMGFATVSHYERLLGLGEKAGWNIPGENPGIYPSQPGIGGVAKLCSFGEGIHISPLQLAAIVTAIANGGTLYYLQHPTTPEEIANFVPRVKRQLDISKLVPVVEDGMMAAVERGTARRAKIGPREIPGMEILGKTGTCSRGGTRFGLFASYLGIQHPQLVVVVILRGNRAVFGPRAAQIAGNIYRQLDHEQYFVQNHHAQPLAAMSLPLVH